MQREQMSQMYDFIVNPKARSGMGGRIWKELEPEIIRERVPYRVHTTQRSGHAEQIAGKITEDGLEHTIVILGGDGTVNEVINGILSARIRVITGRKRAGKKQRIRKQIRKIC